MVVGWYGTGQFLAVYRQKTVAEGFRGVHYYAKKLE